MRTPPAWQRRHLARASRRALAEPAPDRDPGARCRSPLAGAFADARTAADAAGIALRASALGAVVAPFRCRVTRRCTMLRMSASPAGPIPAHGPAHFPRHDCRRHCRRTRRPARHGASHRCPRSCRPGRPLNRRAARLRRVPPRRFPDLPYSMNSASDGPAPVSVATPDASVMLAAHARAEPILASSSEDVRRLPASLSCRIERVSVRYTRFLMGPACPCRSVSPTDTRTDTRGRGPTYAPIHVETREKHRPIHGAIHARRGASQEAGVRCRRPIHARHARDFGGCSRSRSERAPISLSRRRPGAARPGRSGPPRPACRDRPRALRGPSRRAVRSPGTRCSGTSARSARHRTRYRGRFGALRRPACRGPERRT